jgi:membrane fusion protein (multidrug efflux system)
MRTIMLVGGVIILLILGKLFVFSKPGKDKPSEMKKGGASKGSNTGGGAVPVNVYVVGRETIENQIFASGTVLPNEEVNLMAETSGKLIKLDIQEGAYITKGQLIAKINDRELRAQLQKVTYNQELSKKIEARQKKLLNVEAINLEEYDVTSNNIRVLEAEREVIEAQLAKTEIRAPFSGRIGLKFISEGAYMSPGTPIVTIVQSNPVKIDFTVPEKYTPNIRVGNVVKFNLDGDPSTFNARILAVDPKVDENLKDDFFRACL